jgi:hypothetical protein
MEYRPLLSGEIRLIHVLPGLDSDPMKIELLSNISLASAPSYTALSYTWGEPSSTDIILVDGSPLSVTKNLATGLWQLRQRVTDHQKFKLWVDAICINQQDAMEKNTQIPLMRRIYEKAKAVMVWLGPHENESRKAMEILSRVAQRGDRTTITEETLEWFAEDKNYTLIMQAWLASAFLFCRPWFSRMWVIQEVKCR